MRGAATYALVLGLGTLTATMPAAAFHGSPYVLTGTACLDELDLCIPIRFLWSGAGHYRIEHVSPGGNVLLSNTPSSETFPSLVFGSSDWCPRWLEMADYAGFDTQTRGDILFVEGYQHNCLGDQANGFRRMHLAGHWLAFQLDVGM